MVYHLLDLFLDNLETLLGTQIPSSIYDVFGTSAVSFFSLKQQQNP